MNWIFLGFFPGGYTGESLGEFFGEAWSHTDKPVLLVACFPGCFLAWSKYLWDISFVESRFLLSLLGFVHFASFRHIGFSKSQVRCMENVRVVTRLLVDHPAQEYFCLLHWLGSDLHLYLPLHCIKGA